MSRGEVFERIQAALQPAPGAPRRPDDDLPALPSPQAFADPVALFAERARAVGAEVDVVSIDGAAGWAATWCAARAVRRAVVWNTPELAPLRDRLQSDGIETVSPHLVAARAWPDAVAAADAGITGAEWGIAETGTLVLGCGPDQPRLASLLPPAHLAVLRADRILPDLPALLARTMGLPSALTLVTGPSRSADIGLVPVFGAHGPMVVAILIVTG
jgi:L-lactate dehydrogenase complex protein LldG